MPMLALLLTVTLAAPRDPAAVVRDFVTYANAGDVRRASALLAAPENAFTPAQLRVMRNRCAHVVDVEIGQAEIRESTASLDTRETVAILGSLPGAGERLETSLTHFELTKSARGWVIASRLSRDAAAVEHFDANAVPRTETFVRAAVEEVARLVNARHLDDAGALARAAEGVAGQLGDPRAWAEAKTARALVLRFERGADLQRVLQLSREAIPLAEASGDADALARSLLRSVRARKQIEGTIDDAMLERVMLLATSLEDPSIAAHAAILLAQNAEVHGNMRECIRYVELARRYSDASEELAAQISAAMMLTAVYDWSGNQALRDRYVRRAIELSVAAGYIDSARSMMAIQADRQAGAGHPEEALRTIDDALARFGTETVASELLRIRMNVYASQGRFEEAERDLRRVIENEARQPGSATTIELMWATLRSAQGRYEEAIAHAARAHRPGQVDDNARTIAALATRCLGHEDEAIAAMSEILADLELEGSAVADPLARTFSLAGNAARDILIDMLVETGNVPAALELSEQSKATVLTDALQKGGVEDADITSAAERAREQALNARIRELNRALLASAGRPAEMDAQRRQLVEARADLAEFRGSVFATRPEINARHPADLHLDQLPARLDDVTIVTYASTVERTYVFVIEPKQHGDRTVYARVVPITSNDLSAKVERFAAFVEQRNLRANELGAELYHLLLGPVERSVLAAHALCVVPDGVLWRVPFHALGPRDGKKLVNVAPLFYTPSIATLIATERRRESRPHAKTPELLAFANPTATARTVSLYRALDPDTPLGALPETEREVRAIAAIYGRDHSRVYVGRDAREAVLKREAGRVDVLHIATHAIVPDNAPMFSSLLLATAPEDTEEDGVLEAREIIRLNLAADVAVLSACRTGTSSFHSGAGVIGLTWALLAAGCPTTIVSQWNAQSAATADLMVELHRQLAHGHSKPEALRLAQLALRRNPKFRHPFYWAPFIVVGAP